MIIVGLTGGIGSGKTTVANAFNKLGIPIYIADLEAKKLMQNSKAIKRKLINLLGENAYLNNQLNKTFIAEKIFNNKQYLQQINAIVHPKVATHFTKWANKQNAPYVIKEAAILFENNSYKQCNYIITVTASLENRIARLLKRDHTTEKKIQAIINNQWSDDKKLALSHFEIKNNDLSKTLKQVEKVHNRILLYIYTNKN